MAFPIRLTKIIIAKKVIAYDKIIIIWSLVFSNSVGKNLFKSSAESFENLIDPKTPSEIANIDVISRTKPFEYPLKKPNASMHIVIISI